jgi:hypothetical protein
LIILKLVAGRAKNIGPMRGSSVDQKSVVQMSTTRFETR